MNLKILHLYIHIPYCRQACHYCDFHFSTNLKSKSELIECLCKEIILRKDYLKDKNLQTIYFGGGTPSLLHPQELQTIFECIHQNFRIDPQAEITFEANPEDLSIDYLKELFDFGINRLSIGIQSFSERNLYFLNRNHSLKQSINSVEFAQKVGFNKISLDLIFGIPGYDFTKVKEDLNLFLETGVNHLSTYSLTVEPKTVFGIQKKRGLFQEIDDIEMAKQFEFIIETLANKDFEQYEISNFARNGEISKHNSSYWFQEEYLGIGPSAHSFDGKSRQWNVSSNGNYCQSIVKGVPFFEKEKLEQNELINEFILTRLRTTWGLPLEKLTQMTQAAGLSFPKQEIEQWLEQNYAFIEDNHLKLHRKGKMIADKLSADIFYLSEQ